MAVGIAGVGRRPESPRPPCVARHQQVKRNAAHHSHCRTSASRRDYRSEQQRWEKDHVGGKSELKPKKLTNNRDDDA